jgi:hypothetical protein
MAGVDRVGVDRMLANLDCDLPQVSPNRTECAQHQTSVAIPVDEPYSRQ